jgi:hypothetical protein
MQPGPEQSLGINHFDSKFYHPQPPPGHEVFTEHEIPIGENTSPLKIRCLKRFTLDDVVAYYGIPPEKIKQEFENVVKNLFESPAIWPKIEPEGLILLHLWQATRDKTLFDQEPRYASLKDVAYHLDSFDSFLKWRTEISKNKDILYKRKVLSDYFQKINETYNSFSRYRKGGDGITLYSPHDPASVEWISLGKNNVGFNEIIDKKVWDISLNYAANPVIHPYLSNKKYNSKSTESRRLFHDTGTVTLTSIASEGGLVSSSELLRRGKSINSGENIGSINGLENVFASSQGITSGNYSSTYLGDNAITIVINEKMQEEVIRQYILIRVPSITEAQLDKIIAKKLRRLPKFIPLTQHEADTLPPNELKERIAEIRASITTSDTASTPQDYESYLGPYVPLSVIDAMVIPYDEIENQMEWVKENLPERCKVIVREAAEVFNSRPELFSQSSSLDQKEE